MSYPRRPTVKSIYCSQVTAVLIVCVHSNLPHGQLGSILRRRFFFRLFSSRFASDFSLSPGVTLKRPLTIDAHSAMDLDSSLTTYNSVVPESVNSLWIAPLVTDCRGCSTYSTFEYHILDCSIDRHDIQEIIAENCYDNPYHHHTTCLGVKC